MTDLASLKFLQCFILYTAANLLLCRVSEATAGPTSDIPLSFYNLCALHLLQAISVELDVTYLLDYVNTLIRVMKWLRFSQR
jgi:hypothetical protein